MGLFDCEQRTETWPFLSLFLQECVEAARSAISDSLGTVRRKQRHFMPLVRFQVQSENYLWLLAAASLSPRESFKTAS